MSIEKNNREFQTGTRSQIWRDDEDPISAFMTRIAAAAFTAGFDITSTKSFVWIVDEIPGSGDAESEEEADLRHSVTWIWKAGKKVRFDPIESSEEISLEELWRRFSSLEWCEQNPDHPIAYMRIFLEKMNELRRVIDLGPSVPISRGDALAIAPASATEEEIEEIFAAYNRRNDEN